MTTSVVPAPTFTAGLWSHARLATILAVAFVALAVGFFAIGRATSAGTTVVRTTTVAPAGLQSLPFNCRVGHPC